MTEIAKNSRKYLAFSASMVALFQLVFPVSAAIAPSRVKAESILLPNLTINAAATTTDKIFLEQSIKDNDQTEYQVKKNYKMTVTAYSSTIDQTDDTPCITANGYNLCENNQENVIAANFLPFGTKVRLPEKFGDRIFTVQDRMNARYYYRSDVWFKDRAAAIKFGAPYTVVEVVEPIES